MKEVPSSMKVTPPQKKTRLQSPGNVILSEFWAVSPINLQLNLQLLELVYPGDNSVYHRLEPDLSDPIQKS
eukprot:988492-Amphidinium_carterae.1